MNAGLRREDLYQIVEHLGQLAEESILFRTGRYGVPKDD